MPGINNIAANITPYYPVGDKVVQLPLQRASGIAIVEYRGILDVPGQMEPKVPGAPMPINDEATF